MQSYTSGIITRQHWGGRTDTFGGEDRKVGFGLGTFGKMEGGFGLAFNSVLQVARLRLPSNDKSFCFPLPRARINAELKELRVCTNRTCRRQGSMQILETLSSLAPPEVAVKSCGCLGRCGAGPNLVALPDGVVVGHCGTPARASEILMVLCGIKSDHDAAKNLEALALRKRAEAEFEKANFSEADRFLSQVTCAQWAAIRRNNNIM